MSDKPAKDKKAKQGKQKKGKQGDGAGGPSVANHPRASAIVRRCKGAGGLIGFGLAALLAHGAGLSTTQLVERALIAGVAGYLIGWGCSVTVCRQLVQAELRAAMARHIEAAPPMIPLATSAAAPPSTSAPADA